MAQHRFRLTYEVLLMAATRSPRNGRALPGKQSLFLWAKARMTRCFAVLAWSLLIANSALAANSPYDQYRNALVAYFQPLYLLPVLLPRGQKVGDVYDTQDFRLISSAAECFPKLKPVGPTPSDLPAVSLDVDTSVAIAVGAPALASADANLGASRQVHIDYRDVQVSTASIVEISHAYSPSKCPNLAPLINTAYVETAPASPPLVLAEVYSAKKTLTFVVKRNAAASATFDLSKFLKNIGLKASVTAKGNADTGDTFTVVSDEILPIAIRPAFVARRFLGGYMSPGAAKAPVPGITWEPFSKVNPTHQEAFSSIVAAYCKSSS